MSEEKYKKKNYKIYGRYCSPIMIGPPQTLNYHENSRNCNCFPKFSAHPLLRLMK